MTHSIHIRSAAILIAALMGTAAPRALAAPTVPFDQGVQVSGILDAAREDAKTTPAPALHAVPLPATTAAKAPDFTAAHDDTYSQREVLQAITDLGGDISGSVADILAAVFKKSGRPTGVIVGEELQGSFIIGYRRGRGKVQFKNGRESRDLVWRAPSVGFNVGASANKVTILVYNTRDYDRLLQTFVSLQGSYHFILGGGITYMHEVGSDDSGKSVNLAHVAIGVGFDAGVAIEGLTFRKN